MINLKQSIKNIISRKNSLLIKGGRGLLIYGGGGFLFLLLLTLAYYLFFAKDVLKDMVFIPGGEFIMGVDIPKQEQGRREEEITIDIDETPTHKVYIDGFYIDKYEVTNAEFKKFLKATGRKSLLVDPVDKEASYNWNEDNYPEGQSDNPVVLVDFEDAKAYCEWKGKRLPTEEEWEKACRGDDGKKWSFGNEEVSGNANTRELNLKWSGPIGSFPKDISSYKVFDMTGNVMEWTESRYMPYPGTEMRAGFGGLDKVIRGGGWLVDIQSSRCSNRNVAPLTKRHRMLGFRCAKDIR
jgi:formylglycine-generating enzyme required for sulfatase activity